MLFATLCAVGIPIAVVFASPAPKQNARQVAVTLPDPNTFHSQNGTKWKISYVGDIKFTGAIGNGNLMGDKCRSSVLGGRHIWNCGDMTCAAGYNVCGFSMGPAFYGTNDVMTINTSAHTTVYQYTFAAPWSGDPKPVPPQSQYGMDTSNVVPINDTTGIAYAYESTRGSPDIDVLAKGNSVVKVTLGDTQPMATRVGPLLTGNDTVSLGLLAIMRVGDYIYNYNSDIQPGGVGNVLVGRVPANDSAFDATRYEYLTYNSSKTASPQWIRGIPKSSNSLMYGMSSADPSGRFNCHHYGSMFWNNYFQKYMMVCNLYWDYTFFYLSATPWGPWSQGYALLMPPNRLGYGVSAHPSYSPGDSHKTLYFSQGPNTKFNMYKLTFNY